ncbi:MAG: hypothetical protein OXC82_10265 [Rhodobacteraceae bacterium]|nr:hypothetical protein [Paracoccaceae bacterium]MCY4250800.1 hypothetical protein [Paracoccaceae bacterium]
MGKYSLIKNPVTNDDSFGRIINLKITTEPQLASTEADIYLFLGFHRNTKGFLKRSPYFGFKHIRAVHEKEIRNRGFIDKSNGRTLIPEYVASIVRPGSLLYYEGEIRQYPRLLASNQTGMAVLEFRDDDDHGTYWSIVTAYNRRNPHGQLVGKIV